MHVKNTKLKMCTNTIYRDKIKCLRWLMENPHYLIDLHSNLKIITASTLTGSGCQDTWPQRGWTAPWPPLDKSVWSVWLNNTFIQSSDLEGLNIISSYPFLKSWQLTESIIDSQWFCFLVILTLSLKPVKESEWKKYRGVKGVWCTWPRPKDCEPLPERGLCTWISLHVPWMQKMALSWNEWMAQRQVFNQWVWHWAQWPHSKMEGVDIAWKEIDVFCIFLFHGCLLLFQPSTVCYPNPPEGYWIVVCTKLFWRSTRKEGDETASE